MWDAGQLVRGSVVRFLRARNQQGYGIYLLPYAEQYNAGYIMIDLDHAAPHVLPLMRANGHEPCVVLQSSPGHLQVWIRVSTTPLERAVATAIRPLSPLLRNTVLTCVCTPWYLVFGSLDAIRIRRAKERIQPRETRR